MSIRYRVSPQRNNEEKTSIINNSEERVSRNVFEDIRSISMVVQLSNRASSDYQQPRLESLRYKIQEMFVSKLAYRNLGPLVAAINSIYTNRIMDNIVFSRYPINPWFAFFIKIFVSYIISCLVYDKVLKDRKSFLRFVLISVIFTLIFSFIIQRTQFDEHIILSFLIKFIFKVIYAHTQITDFCDSRL